jgi:type 1 fimbria pilin
VQKQAGINDYTLNTAVTLPHGAQLIRESNIGNGTVTSGDVQAEVIYR